MPSSSATAEVRYRSPSSTSNPNPPYRRVAKIRDVQFSTSRDALDTTGIGDEDRTYVPGIRASSGSGNLIYDRNDSAAIEFANRILNAPSGTPEDDSLQIVFDTNSTTQGTFTGTPVITQAGASVSVGDLVTVPISFNFSGKPSGAF